MEKFIFPRVFLLFLLVLVIFACYLVFKPFLVVIIISAILVSIFYTPYEWLAKKLWGYKKVAAFIMCIGVTLLVVLPIINFIIYAAQQSVVGYDNLQEFISNNHFSLVNNNYINIVKYSGVSEGQLQQAATELFKYINNWLVGGATQLIMGTTNFVVSLFLIIFTMFFFFLDGQKMVEKLMFWTPLPNKYDKEIFKKFRSVSRSAIFSTFIAAIAQALVGAIGFAIVGLPAFLPGILMGFCSMLPFGTMIVWLPVAIYFLVVGQLWQGIFLFAYGMLVVGTVDNVLRAYLIKGKAEVHPIFVVFSVLGGIALFGFWGVIFGPLIISLTVTILHIYELEYEEMLEK
jgi:predicted PurR-regulated permease PerM